MDGWKIKVSNHTDQHPDQKTTVNVMVFQVATELGVNSYSNAWEVSEVACPGYISFNLPIAIEFGIVDKGPSGEKRYTGPFAAAFGHVYEVIQTSKATPPSFNDTGEKPKDKKNIAIINKAGNAQPLEFALYKNGKMLLSEKGVNPAEQLLLSIKSAIFIAEQGDHKVGSQFEAVVESAEATKIDLDLAVSNIDIGIYRKVSGEIYFK